MPLKWPVVLWLSATHILVSAQLAPMQAASQPVAPGSAIDHRPAVTPRAPQSLNISTSEETVVYYDTSLTECPAGEKLK